MLKISLGELKKIISGDNCELREYLHPEKSDISLRYSLAHAVVSPGQSTIRHKLKTSEVYYILEGSGVMQIGDEKKDVARDDVVYIPPMAVQSIKNTGECDLKFLCIVDPAWRMDDEIIMEKK